MRRLKVVLDTNVLISARFWKGISHKIFNKCKSGEIEIVLSQYILSEFARILEREEKFLQTTEGIKKELSDLEIISSIVVPKEEINIVKDSKDNPIVECAVAGNVDYIVTGDKHLLDLKSFRRIKIVSPREMWEIIND